MKKVLAVVAVVCVMSVAGAALAQHSGHNGRQPMNHPRMMLDALEGGRNGIAHHPQNVSRDFRAPRGDTRPGHSGHEGMKCSCRNRMRKVPTFTPDMPQEIRDKAAELAKLRIDLEEAMTSRPVNKEKALEVHAEMQKVKQEIETWRFTKRLERIEARQKKGLSPAPEKAAETPEDESAE